MLLDYFNFLSLQAVMACCPQKAFHPHSPLENGSLFISTLAADMLPFLPGAVMM
jgi:hypothetical protein